MDALRLIAMSSPVRTDCVARDRDTRDAERLDRDIANRDTAAGLAGHPSGGAAMMRSCAIVEAGNA
jgi:hypothetical protein